MTVDDVGAFLDELERRTGARRWSGNRETFAAAGTKAGSLIVVGSTLYIVNRERQKNAAGKHAA